MKVAKPDITYHSSGIKRKKSYNIANTPQMAMMLSDMLYKNKIRAAIRELSTNAWDAHIIADTTNKVPDLHLPDRLDKEFRLRDYGDGLPIEHLENMYQTYGASDKTDSDFLNGKFGIGAKSPLAYANMFTTTSYYNGMKYVYVNSKDRSGMPQLQCMLEEPTDEPNGLEISFVCDPSDIDKFHSEAEDVLGRFPKAFNVTGGKGKFTPKKYKYILERDSWKLREYDSYHKTSYVVMGNVAYPIDADVFSYEKDGENSDPNDKIKWYKHYDYGSRQYVSKNVFYSELLNCCVELYFDLDEGVEMNISREGLQYTKETVQVIKNKLESIVKEVATEFEKEVDTQKSMWDASVKMQQLIKSQNSNLRNLINAHDIKWKGQEIKTYFDLTKDDLKGITISTFHDTSYRVTPERNDNQTRIHVGENAAFFVADKKVGNYIAVQRAMKNDGLKTVYLVKADDNSPLTENRPIKRILEACDYRNKIKKCSDVPVPKSTSKKGPIEKVFLFGSSTKNYYKKGYWKVKDVDFDDGGYYVEINNWQTRKNNTDDSFHITGSSIINLISSLKELGITAPTFYGVKSVAIKKYNKSDDWVNFFDYAEKEVNKYLVNNTIGNKYHHIVNYNNWRNHGYWEAVCKQVVPKLEKNGTILKNLVDKLSDIDIMKKKWGPVIDSMDILSSVIGTEFKSGKKTKDLINWDQLEKEIYAEYPLFHIVDNYDLGYRNNTQYIIKTINLIDSCKKGKVENE